MQDALVGATDKQSGQHEKDGEVFYDYEVTGAVSQTQGLILGLLVVVQHADQSVPAGLALLGIDYTESGQSICSLCQVSN